jgi:hypothetical protein
MTTEFYSGDCICKKINWLGLSLPLPGLLVRLLQRLESIFCSPMGNRKNEQVLLRSHLRVFYSYHYLAPESSLALFIHEKPVRDTAPAKAFC